MNTRLHWLFFAVVCISWFLHTDLYLSVGLLYSVTHSHSLYKAHRIISCLLQSWRSVLEKCWKYIHATHGRDDWFKFFLSKWTNHAQYLVCYVFLQAVLLYHWHYKYFSIVSLSSRFSHAAGYFSAWGISRICVWVFVCVCVCVVLSFVFTVNDSVQSQHASCLNRDGFEQTFIFIHISCKNNTNRRNDRESVCLSFPLLWYIHNLFICFLYHQLKCMFLITDN